MKRFAAILSGVLAVALLTGCLDTILTTSFNRDGSGRLTLEYLVDQLVFDTGVFDGSDAARPIPISEREFNAAASSIPGIELVRYGRREKDGQIAVTAVLGFDGAEALEKFLGSATIDIQSNGETTTWRQLVLPGDGSGSESALAMAADLDGYSITYVVDPHGVITNATGPGVVWDKDTATVVIGLSEIVLATEEAFFTVEW